MFFSFFMINSAYANIDNQGNEFILAFMPNFDNTNIVELHLATEVATDVQVQYPVNNPTFDTTVSVIPGTVTIVELPNAASIWTQNAVANNAVRAAAVNGIDEFVAYVINRRSFSTDAALGLPIDTFNTEYILSTYNATLGGGQFIVYAAFDNTTVTITPTNNITGNLAGVPFDVTLNSGEAYYGRSSASVGTAGSLMGTTVSATRPVGVINGNVCTNIPSNTSFCDHIFEVAQPVASWGTEILVTNLPNRPNGSIYRIVASEDSTNIDQDGVSIGNINRGEFIETAPLPDNHVFSSDNPIYVVQFMTGSSSPGAVTGDPSMGNMIPSEQYLSEYTFSTVGGNQFAENFLSIIANNADLATISLDGTPIGAGSFTAIPNTNFSSAVVPLTDGTHQTLSASPHGITVEGYNQDDSYIYPGGALFSFINPAGDANPPLCTSEVTMGEGGVPMLLATATDNRPSEDVNGNGVLDPGEDLNNNGQIDEDTGIFTIDSISGTNIIVTVPTFVPSDPQVQFSVVLVDETMPGTGVVEASDGAGNSCTFNIMLGDETPLMCDVNGDEQVDRIDIAAIARNRNVPVSEGNPALDINNDGVINVVDARLCVSQCTNARCAPTQLPQ
ncbi:hypothetical protein DXX93_09395 [Thalassotalea euphylliae]|uniref:IgGFc-binding protein N-terminal domain-containing protein n=2 Tax=Thalassotalea euphylliae TaxID=1655234 RepID=A0A3E0TQZ8_9GAMM|nr:hypothetical protein DXX93_09395 [Thalassotalea euphylliae]